MWRTVMMRQHSYSPTEPDGYMLVVPRRVVIIVIIIMILLLLLLIIIPLLVYSNQSCSTAPSSAAQSGTGGNTDKGKHYLLDSTLQPRKYWLTVKVNIPNDVTILPVSEQFTFVVNVSILCDSTITRGNVTLLMVDLELIEPPKVCRTSQNLYENWWIAEF